MKLNRVKINFFCIMFEGVFSFFGNDLLHLAVIVPLFLLDYGASTATLGFLTTIEGISMAIVPFLFGNVVFRAVSKRKLSLVVNSLSRATMLLLPIILIINLPNKLIIGLFFLLMVTRFIARPINGLSWNYLFHDCIHTNDRPKLLGALFTISGIVSLGSSYFIKIIRDSGSIPMNVKYFYIFGVAAVSLAASTLFFLPLKENVNPEKTKPTFNLKEYTLSLLSCFKMKDFRKYIRAKVFSYATMTLNVFLFVFATKTLKLAPTQISNLIISQTLGIIAGGMVAGNVSARFGVKRMLILTESVGLLIPILALFSLAGKEAYLLIYICLFFNGFSRSGISGYNNYLIEVVDKEMIVHIMVANGLIILPVTFLSTMAGIYIKTNPMILVFIVQIALSCTAIFMCARLRLVKRDVINIRKKGVIYESKRI